MLPGNTRRTHPFIPTSTLKHPFRYHPIHSHSYFHGHKAIHVHTPQSCARQSCHHSPHEQHHRQGHCMSQTHAGRHHAGHHNCQCQVWTFACPSRQLEGGTSRQYKGKTKQLETDMESSTEEHFPEADDQEEADIQQAISASMSANIRQYAGKHLSSPLSGTDIPLTYSILYLQHEQRERQWCKVSQSHTSTPTHPTTSPPITKSGARQDAHIAEKQCDPLTIIRTV
jgi:hypothetical protein